MILDPEKQSSGLISASPSINWHLTIHLNVQLQQLNIKPSINCSPKAMAERPWHCCRPPKGLYSVGTIVFNADIYQIWFRIANCKP